MEPPATTTHSPMRALFPKTIVTTAFFLSMLSFAWSAETDGSNATRWRTSTYRARPSTSIGVSISSGPGPYYYGPRGSYPVYRSYGGPVYVTPPPVVYGPPPVVYAAPRDYYGKPVPSPVAPLASTRLLQVQENLRRLGYYRGRVDGVNGTGTRNAIRAYQVDRGLPVNGRVDRELLQDLGL